MSSLETMVNLYCGLTLLKMMQSGDPSWNNFDSWVTGSQSTEAGNTPMENVSKSFLLLKEEDTEFAEVVLNLAPLELMRGLSVVGDGESSEEEDEALCEFDLLFSKWFLVALPPFPGEAIPLVASDWAWWLLLLLLLSVLRWRCKLFVLLLFWVIRKACFSHAVSAVDLLKDMYGFSAGSWSSLFKRAAHTWKSECSSVTLIFIIWADTSGSEMLLWVLIWRLMLVTREVCFKN